MKLGINYDTGIFPGKRRSREVFDPEQAAFDMKVIARNLHCAAVRITGGDPERISVAAGYAAEEGLDVWFSPHPCELDTKEMLAAFEDCALRAEALRGKSAGNVVLVLGCEVSVFGRGFLPGADSYARMGQLMAPSPELFGEYPAILARLNAFLAEAVAVSRERFSGAITYASGAWEQIDWEPFTLVGVDAYRDKSNEVTFDQQLDAWTAQGKPVAVTEFGCCTYRGAGEQGANGWAILSGEGEDQQLAGDYARDESEQVAYLRELLAICERHAVDTAFWFTFASWNRPHRPDDPRRDMDLASFGVVKVSEQQSAIPSRNWSPKAVFHEFANRARSRPRPSVLR